MKRWIRISKWTADSWKEIPPTPGVYVIYSGNKVLYVGSTHSLRSRISGYQVSDRWSRWANIPKLSIKYRTFRRFGEWLMVEARLIVKIKPEFNKKLRTALDFRNFRPKGAAESVRVWMRPKPPSGKWDVKAYFDQRDLTQ